MDLANYALFGDSPNYSSIPATSMTPYAENSTDWGAVLATGIINNMNLAIQNKINEKAASGQLRFTSNGVQLQGSPIMLLILGGVIVYMLAKS